MKDLSRCVKALLNCLVVESCNIHKLDLLNMLLSVCIHLMLNGSNNVVKVLPFIILVSVCTHLHEAHIV